jgi:hypothetical protein
MKPVIWLLAAAAVSVPGVAGTDAWRLPLADGPWGWAGANRAAPMPARDYPREPAWPGYPPPRSPESYGPQGYVSPGYGYGYGPSHPGGGPAGAYGAPGYGSPYGDAHGYGAQRAHGAAIPAYGYGYGEPGGATGIYPPATLPAEPRRGEGGWWHPEPAQAPAPVRPWPPAAFREPAQPYRGTTFWGADRATPPPVRGMGGYSPDRPYGDALPPPPRPDWDREVPEIDDLPYYPSPYSDGYGAPWDLPAVYPQDGPDDPQHPDALGWGAPDWRADAYPPAVGDGALGGATAVPDYAPPRPPAGSPPLATAPVPAGEMPPPAPPPAQATAPPEPEQTVAPVAEIGQPPAAAQPQ